jgi:hypothetical protein
MAPQRVPNVPLDRSREGVSLHILAHDKDRGR